MFDSDVENRVRSVKAQITYVACARRTPHTAFRDPSFSDAKSRSSIEFRTIAYFD